jgi:hypothetical protein
MIDEIDITACIVKGMPEISWHTLCFNPDSSLHGGNWFAGNACPYILTIPSNNGKTGRYIASCEISIIMYE